MKVERYIGLMSGTSLDGIDAVLADFEGGMGLVDRHFRAFPDPLRRTLAALNQPASNELACAATAAIELTGHYAQAIRHLLATNGIRPDAVRAIGCHGQTVRHRPSEGYTIQLVNGALLAELTGIDVVCDFRSRDLAAGGQGAPLVPAFHCAAFRSDSVHRVIVNIGGIANITDLPPRGEVHGFDCGPGNALLDDWIACSRALPYDDAGAWAASGSLLPDLLDRLRQHPFFDQPPPKSTGRDVFHLAWIRPLLRPGYAPADVQATLAELTADAIGAAVRRYCPAADEIYVCGGGARNADLMTRLARQLPGRALHSTAVLGIDPDWVEAFAFAWLARETLARRPGNLPSVTGASGYRVLGCIYPA